MNPQESTQTWDFLNEEWQLTFVWEAPAWTMNEANSQHFRTRQTLRQEWREAHRLMAEGCEPLAYAHTVTVQHEYADKACDTVAIAPAYKAALDGIKNAGILIDDSPEYVQDVTFLAPKHTGRDALIITLKGPARDNTGQVAA